jgi:hypothetical protein
MGDIIVITASQSTSIIILCKKIILQLLYYMYNIINLHKGTAILITNYSYNIPRHLKILSEFQSHHNLCRALLCVRILIMVST